MPIDTYIAGEPGEIEALGSAMSSRMTSALDNQRATLSGPRNAYQSVWQGPSGEKVADTASDLIKDIDHLQDGFTKVGSAISRFGEELSAIKTQMTGYRVRAGDNELTVVGYLIEDVPALVPMAYSSDGPIPPDVTDAIDRHQAKVRAFNELVEDADRTVSDYADSCQALTETIGNVVDEGWLADLVLGAVPGSLDYLGDDILRPLAGRLGQSRHLSGMLNGISGNAMGDFVGHMFASVNGVRPLDRFGDG